MKQYIRQLDEQFEEYLKRAKTRTKETDLTEEKRAERRSRCDNDEFEFCKEYYPEIFYEPFNKVHYFISSLTSGEWGITAARFFGKTAYTIFAKIVKKIALGDGGLIGYAMRDKDDAKERTFVIYQQIAQNKKLCYDYSIRVQQKIKGHYIINNTTFVGLGMREGLRNWSDKNMKRFSLLICDDLYNAQTISEKDNKKVYSFVTTECAGQLEPGGLLLWFYNIITANSPGDRWAKEKPDSCYSLPAVDEHGNTNWPGSRWDNKALEEKKKSLPYDVWMGDWMCQAFILGEIFKEDWLRTINVSNINIGVTIAVVDPSFGKSPSACKKGAVFMGMDINKDRYIMLDVYNRLGEFSLLFDWLYEGYHSYPAVRAILWENDFAQWNLASKYYDDWKKQTGKSLPIIPFLSSQSATLYYGADKTGRIMNLVYPYNAGKIYTNEMLEGTQDYKEWKFQYLAFGKSGEKLDALDAEASAFIMIPGYSNPGQIETIKQRTRGYKNHEDSWLHNR